MTREEFGSAYKRGYNMTVRFWCRAASRTTPRRRLPKPLG